MTHHITAARAALRLRQLTHHRNSDIAMRALHRWLEVDHIMRDFGVLARDIPKMRRDGEHRHRVGLLVDEIVRNACFAVAARDTAAGEAFAAKACAHAVVVARMLALQGTNSIQKRMRASREADRVERLLQSQPIDDTVK